MSYRVAMLTTIDNPFDPFTQFDQWFAFDLEKKHNCCSLVARIAKTAPEFTENETSAEIERAIDEILLFDYEGIYKKEVRMMEEK